MLDKKFYTAEGFLKSASMDANSMPKKRISLCGITNGSKVIDADLETVKKIWNPRPCRQR